MTNQHATVINGGLKAEVLADGTLHFTKTATGEILLDLQAMKMNNHLLAPVNTVVKKIYVKQGERVSKNQLLVELK